FFLGSALFSVFASGLAAQLSASRLLYAMGRDEVIPKKLFGYLHPKLNSPVFNIIFVGLLALPALVLSLEVATSLVNIGAFTAFSFVCCCLFFFFFFFFVSSLFFFLFSLFYSLFFCHHLFH